MKMDMSAKPTGEDMPKSNEGTYDQEHLEEMLEHFITAKKIEADPALLATVKDYALSKNKMIAELFDVPSKTPAKTLKDLKGKYDKLVEKPETESEED